jgi:hypothetical protein
LSRHIYDQFGGLLRTVEYDEADDALIIKSSQDAEAIVGLNAIVRAERRGQKYGDLTPIANIPITLWEKWVQEDGVNPYRMKPMELKAWMKRRLNSSDYRNLRLTEGVW